MSRLGAQTGVSPLDCSTCAMRGVAFRPVPVSITTVLCSALIAPDRSLDDWRPLLVRRLRANCPEERDIIDFPTRDTNQYSRRRCEMTPATIKLAILVLAIPLTLPAARYSLAQIRTGGESGSHLSQYCVPPEETLDTRNFYCRGMTKRTVPDAAYLTNPKGDDHEGKSISVALKKAVPTLRRLWRCARLELLDCCWHPFE
jgi:hypothetical protein